MYNKSFELDLHDIDIIELCLNEKIRKLSEQRLLHIQSTIKPMEELERVKEIDDEIKQVQLLLGKIHNQKKWYRPQGTYISG